MVYKGYFVPIDASDCPPLTTVATTAAAPAAEINAAQWADPPARVASKLKPSRNGVKQNTDIEVFNSEKGSTTTAATTMPDKDKQPNINIEIHNVFSFGGANSSSFSPKNEETDNKFTVTQNEHTNSNSNPPIIYA